MNPLAWIKEKFGLVKEIEQLARCNVRTWVVSGVLPVKVEVRASTRDEAFEISEAKMKSIMDVFNDVIDFKTNVEINAFGPYHAQEKP